MWRLLCSVQNSVSPHDLFGGVFQTIDVLGVSLSVLFFFNEL